MNKEEVKDLINDMWKDELSKSGKRALEEYIRDLQSQLDIANKHILEARAMEDKLNHLIEGLEEDLNNTSDELDIANEKLYQIKNHAQTKKIILN